MEKINVGLNADERVENVHIAMKTDLKVFVVVEIISAMATAKIQLQPFQLEDTMAVFSDPVQVNKKAGEKATCRTSCRILSQRTNFVTWRIRAVGELPLAVGERYI